MKNVMASIAISTWGAVKGSSSAPIAGETRMLELLSAEYVPWIAPETGRRR